MKAGTIMNFPKVGQPLIFYVLVVTFTCLCCFSAAEAEDCYRGLDFVDFANPCSDQPGQPAMYPLCPKGQKSEERCTGRCDYCREGTYQDVFTNCMTCLDCITAADCPSGQVIIQNCTRNSNAVCGCPPSPPCPTCTSCPPVTPCPSITPCPVQTECPACECPTDVPESAPHTTPPGTFETSDGNISDSDSLVDCGTNYLKILFIISGVLNLVFIFVLCLIVWKKRLWKGIELGRTGARTECNDLRGVEGGNTGNSEASNSVNTRGIELGHTGARTECNDLRGAEGGNTGNSEASNSVNTRASNGSVSSATQLSNAGDDRLASTDQPLEVNEGLISADPLPVSVNFSSDVANHSGDAVYGHNGDDDATVERIY